MGWTLLVLILLMVSIWLYGRYWHMRANEQIHIRSMVHYWQALEIVNSKFGKTWTREKGPGQFNLKPMFRKAAPTLSVSVVERGEGVCEVSIWVSTYPPMFGLMNHGRLMNRKKAALASAFAEARPAELH
jgi:hypothetical protein